MKYYRIVIETLYNNNTRFRSQADGKYIPNANDYFYRMRNGEILIDAPVFDFFFLRNYDELVFPDTHLMDVHSFIGEGSQSLGWLISENLKLLVDNFKLIKPNAFYPSKLLYENEKLDYYFFQFTGKQIINQIREKNINWGESVFFNPIDKTIPSINSTQDFTDEKVSIMRKSKYEKEIELKKIILNKLIDFFPMATYLKDDIVSERLKQAIEDAGITGFEFSELDYDVVVEE